MLNPFRLEHTDRLPFLGRPGVRHAPPPSLERRLVLPGGRRVPGLRLYPWPVWCAGACGRDLNRTAEPIYLEPGRSRLRCRCLSCDLAFRAGAELAGPDEGSRDG